MDVNQGLHNRYLQLVGRSGKIYALDIHPAGTEPMPSLKYNPTRSVYRMPHPEDRTPPTCHEYESRIYANYTASPDAEVSIHVELTGANSWWSTDGLATSTWTGSA
jgi:hypothetical protein